jgi:dipeptidyl aminopeptidase/acylaminoacyl peptidase
MPHTLILHGTEDSAVPGDGSIEWEGVVKKFGQGKVQLHLEPGGAHGSDFDIPLER